MKLITQFKNWILSITGHKNSPVYTVFICIIIILMLITSGYSQQVEKLETRLESQKNIIDKIYKDTGYKHVDSLYMEIMDLGHQLDSMHLRYD